MADSRPITPPPGKPVQDINTPCQTDGFYSILVERDSTYYQTTYPMKRGFPYAALPNADVRTVAQYATNPLFFLKELRPGSSSASDFGSSDLYVLWVFATVELAQDTYDAAVDYDGDNPSTPIFTRVSTIRRKTYDDAPTIAFGTALTGLMSVNLTAPGINYTFATATVAGGGVAEAVCFNGAIIDWIVTRQGSGVANAAGMTIVGDGTGATASTRIQPSSAVLVSQQKRELSDDDPHSHDYVQVIRIYSTLPGANVYDSTYDSEADIWITKSKQKKALSAITPSVTHSLDNSVTIVSIEGIDANMGYEVVTVIPKSPHFDVDTAIIEDQMLPYQFPGFLLSYGDYLGMTYTAVDFFGPSVGVRQTTSLTVLHIIRTWFVIDEDKPVFVYDEITPGDIVINGQAFNNILFDDTSRTYTGLYGTYLVTIPATVPSFTEYYGTTAGLTIAEPPPDPFAPGTPPKWIGTERVIKGGVERAGSEYRWKVTSISVTMR